MTTTKLAIMILIIAALLFVFVPNLSWANYSRPASWVPPSGGSLLRAFIVDAQFSKSVVDSSLELFLSDRELIQSSLS